MATIDINITNFIKEVLYYILLRAIEANRDRLE